MPAGRRPAISANWSREDWIKALDANMLAPIELMKATIDGMIARQFGRIVNITSHAVKAPIGMLGLSNGARVRPDRFRRGPCARQPPSTTSPSTICCRARSIPTG